MVGSTYYIPDRGDVVYMSLGPTRGKEQRGRRPAIILTSRRYNERVGLLVACPVTSQIKGYPFEVSIILQGKENSVLCDHVRSLDWKVRQLSYLDKASSSVLELIMRKISILFNN